MYHTECVCVCYHSKTIFEQHGISRHGYADDKQLCCCPIPLQDVHAVEPTVVLQGCLPSWMRASKLKLNDWKIECVVATPKIAKKVVNNRSIRVRLGEITIESKESVRYY